MQAGVVQAALVFALRSACQRNACDILPRRVGPLRGRRSHRSHVLQATLARQLPGVISH
jgi:hypothetical protein